MKIKKKLVKKEVVKEGDITAVKPHCRMKVCEDPETGDIVLTYEEGCPKGYIERIAGKITTDGMRFRKTKDIDKE